MGSRTRIEWCDSTWNPLIGCSRVSEGCRNCYAERQAHRFQHLDGYSYTTHTVNGNPAWTGCVNLVEKHLLDPLQWGPFTEHTPACKKCVSKCSGKEKLHRGCTDRPRRIFVNSMSDLFHENVTDEMLYKIALVMVLAYWHTFQILTKRPQRLARFEIAIRKAIADLQNLERAGGISKPDVFRALDMRRRNRIEWVFPLPNVWLGVSVENQAAADERIPLLLQTPAAVRFVNCEPLLGPVDLTKIDDNGDGYYSTLDGMMCCEGRGWKQWQKLDWVNAGGESGPRARPMHPDWAGSLCDQCEAAGVPFFFKQWGEWHEVEKDDPLDPFCPRMVQKGDAFVTPCGEFDILGPDLCSQYESSATPMRRVGKEAAGCLLDGVEHKAFPAVD